ncbi:hypothetical protein RKD52_000020 [Metabacillus sp. SLBN-84]
MRVCFLFLWEKWLLKTFLNFLLTKETILCIIYLVPNTNGF